MTSSSKTMAVLLWFLPWLPFTRDPVLVLFAILNSLITFSYLPPFPASYHHCFSGISLTDPYFLFYSRHLPVLTESFNVLGVCYMPAMPKLPQEFCYSFLPWEVEIRERSALRAPSSQIFFFLLLRCVLTAKVTVYCACGSLPYSMFGTL